MFAVIPKQGFVTWVPQWILSPLRLPFRHIGAARHEFKRFMRPAKMNFVVATRPMSIGTGSNSNA
jgi:hypothetical protein